VPPAQRTSLSARRVFAAALLALGLGGVSGIALGQKELHWKALDVSARLDADGQLHVVERHAMVFTGDWNGGERTFRLAPGQTLSFERIQRIDPATGPDSARELARGDLNQNDHFQFTNPTTLRWRSRLPSDPDFADTEIDYEISYTLAGVLLKQGGRYVLDHNFALPDANRPIEAFSVDLELDPAWAPPPDFERRRTAKRLTPGENFVVHAELGRTAGAAPAAVRVGTTKPARVVMFVLLLLSTLAMGVAFYRREAALGRLDVPAKPDAIDEAWLGGHLFTLLPEEAGALWDDTVGAPEVTAVLARLTAEKKIETVASGKEMTMRLKVSLDTFDGYERELVHSLFFGGRTDTSTSEIKKHYKSSGFDPASKIKPGVLERLAKHADFQDRSGRPGRALTFALFAAGLAILVFEALRGAIDWGTVIRTVLFTGFWWAIGLAAAIRYQNRMDRLLPWAISFLFVPLLFLWSSWRGIASAGITPLPVLIGQLALWLAAVNNLFNVAKTRSGPKKVARRRELVAARRFFESELSKSAPRLKDAWFPWLAAFGLGPDVDRWFRSFGGATASASSGSSFSSSSSSSASSGSFSGESGGFTGGGGFSGGAGSSGSWAVAAGALASGVSAPSSSGGGGGGGGGSSGGGGGGGW
jgi:uncharacterized membrane protein YgcG